MVMPALSEMKTDYNKLIARFNDANVFLNSDKPEQVKEMWLPEFRKLVNIINDLIERIEAAQQQPMTQTEISEGFKDV